MKDERLPKSTQGKATRGLQKTEKTTAMTGGLSEERPMKGRETK